jgi:hypothetical protein
MSVHPDVTVLEEKFTMKRMALLLIVILGLSALTLCAAQPQIAMLSKTSESPYKTPEDVIIKLVPVLGDIPRRFLLGDGYDMNLNSDVLRMDHKGKGSSILARKHACLLSLGVSTRLSGFLSSGINLPLFSGDQIRPSSLAFNSRGDFDIYVSRHDVGHTTLQLFATTRF